VDIVLAGATGFIGSDLRRRLAAKHRVFAVTRGPEPPTEEGVTWITADLSQHDVGPRLPETVDAVVYLAQGRRYHDFPEGAWDVFGVNVFGLMSLLEYARQRNVRRFVLTSSANVYQRSFTPITERAPTEPTSFYARAKRAGELLAESYGQVFRCLILRLFTVYGPGQTRMLIPELVDRVRRREMIQLDGREGFRLSPIFLHDVSSVIQVLIERDEESRGTEIFNVGGDESVGIRQLGQLIGRALRISARFERRGESEPAGWVADSSKLKSSFGLGPFLRLEEGLERTVTFDG